MANIRFGDKPQLTWLDGAEVIPATSTNGGTDTSGNPVLAGNDIHLTPLQIEEWVKARRQAVNPLSIISGVATIDWSLPGDYFTLELTANVTLAHSNIPSAGSRAVRIHQDATGSRTFTHPSSHKAITGSDTSVQSAAGAYTILMLTTFDGGTRIEYSMKAGAA